MGSTGATDPESVGTTIISVLHELDSVEFTSGAEARSRIDPESVDSVEVSITGSDSVVVFEGGIVVGWRADKSSST